MPNPRGSILRLERGLDRATRVCGRIARPSRPSWKPSPLSVSLRRLARRGRNECVSLSATCEPQQVDPAPPTLKPKRRAHKGRRLRTKKRSNDSERKNTEVPVCAIRVARLRTWWERGQRGRGGDRGARHRRMDRPSGVPGPGGRGSSHAVRGRRRRNDGACCGTHPWTRRGRQVAGIVPRDAGYRDRDRAGSASWDGGDPRADGTGRRDRSHHPGDGRGGGSGYHGTPVLGTASCLQFRFHHLLVDTFVVFAGTPRFGGNAIFITSLDIFVALAGSPRFGGNAKRTRHLLSRGMSSCCVQFGNQLPKRK